MILQEEAEVFFLNKILLKNAKNFIFKRLNEIIKNVWSFNAKYPRRSLDKKNTILLSRSMCSKKTKQEFNSLTKSSKSLTRSKIKSLIKLLRIAKKKSTSSSRKSKRSKTTRFVLAWHLSSKTFCVSQVWKLYVVSWTLIILFATLWTNFERTQSGKQRTWSTLILENLKTTMNKLLCCSFTHETRSRRKATCCNHQLTINNSKTTQNLRTNNPKRKRRKRRRARKRKLNPKTNQLWNQLLQSSNLKNYKLLVLNSQVW